ncbi:hypothetical protein [Nodosilinea nodulosa]|uniref:hypothetical protein n=1 Tax=Nodosilinea nodulosa TaxID=416001 RepID=UPI0018C2B267|nr:hypothetical protein [Nodosilinea nodulosa]
MFRRDRPLVHRFLLILGLGAAALMPFEGGLAAQESSAAPASSYLRPPALCPSDLTQLTARLLADLPSYANRVASRSQSVEQLSTLPPNTVIVAGQPDFTPLDLAPAPSPAEPGDRAPLRQIFFTTLERQYWHNQIVSLQNFHWLFLVQSDDGWHMALLYSSLGQYPMDHRAPTPPQESSNGIVGQAVRLWLRDCRAGAIFPADAEEYAVPPDSESPSESTQP